LYCCTNSLSMKHVNAPKSKNVWVSIVISLLHLIMTRGNVISWICEHECEHMSINRSKYYIIYSYHVTRVISYRHFQHGRIFFDDVNIFFHVNEIFEYFTTSFNYTSLSSWNKSNHHGRCQGNQV
jgi:hypothetical protein